MKFTDEQLLIQIQDGDEDAFGSIYGKYVSSIRNFAAYMGIPAASTEDIAQEVFITLIKHSSRFDSKRGTVPSFLFGIARNRILRWLRDNSREIVAMPDEEASTPEMENPLVEFSKDEQIRRLQKAIQALPEHYREVVILCDIQELSYEQTAEMIGCAVGTVRSRLHRAREILTKRLRKTADEEEGVSHYELSILETGSF